MAQLARPLGRHEGGPTVRWVPSFPQLWPHPQPPAQLLWPAHSEGSGSALGLVLLSHVRGTAPGAHPTAPVLFSRADACRSLRIQEDGSCWVYVPTPPLRSPATLGKLLAHCEPVSSCKWGSLTPVPRDWDTWMNSHMQSIRNNVQPLAGAR